MKSEEIQQQILKILFGLKEMNSSLTIMSSGWVADRPLNPTMLQTFVEQLHKLLQKSIMFSSNHNHPIHHDTPIIECMEESIKSYPSEQQETKSSKHRSYQIRIQSQSNDPTEIDIVELVNLNHELSEENQQLTKKLEQAGSRILALEDDLEIIEKSQYQYKEDGGWGWENKKLRMELEKAENLLAQNNQEFIEEIQKYNERIWRGEREVKNYKVKVLEQKGLLEEKDFIISKLKLKNMDLEMNSRMRVRSESKQGTERVERTEREFLGSKEREREKEGEGKREVSRDKDRQKNLQFSRFKNSPN